MLPFELSWSIELAILAKKLLKPSLISCGSPRVVSPTLRVTGEADLVLWAISLSKPHNFWLSFMLASIRFLFKMFFLYWQVQWPYFTNISSYKNHLYQHNYLWDRWLVSCLHWTSLFDSVLRYSCMAVSNLQEKSLPATECIIGVIKCIT